MRSCQREPNYVYKACYGKGRVLFVLFSHNVLDLHASVRVVRVLVIDVSSHLRIVQAGSVIGIRKELLLQVVDVRKVK